MGDCSAIGNSKEISANSQLVFDQRHARFLEVRQVTCIEVPKSWKNAHDLALSADSSKCKEAMRRLLGGDSEPNFDAWHPEWRPPRSQVTEQKDRVMVRYESWNLIDAVGDFQVGPWKVNVEPGKATVALHSPGALRRASWKDIRVDPGGLGISDALGDWETEKESGTRIWIGQGLDIKVVIVPPKALGLRDNTTLSSLFIVSWWVCASAVIAVSAWPFVDRRKKDGSPEKAAIRVLAATVLQWAGLSAALGLTLLLLLGAFKLNAWRPLIGILSGLTLVLLARPWLPLAQGSDNSNNKGMKRRTVVVAVSAAAAVAAAISLLVIRTPHLFGLSPKFMPTARPPALGIAGLVVLDLSMLWMWLIAIAAWAWRFIREGRLGEPSAGSRPEYPLRRMVAIGVALAVVAVAVMFFRYRSFEKKWHRADWLGEGRDLFGADRLGVLSQQLTDFALIGPTWLYSYTWVLSGFALVALLHSSSRADPETLGPQGWDLVLVTAVFALVPLRAADFGGQFGSVYGLWLPLNMVVLYVVVKVGSRWSVLGRVGRKAGMNCIVAELSSPAGYQRLTEYAHRFRDLVRRLHAVDQGNTEGGTRRNLEKQLRSLHHWRPAGCGHDCLPDAVSVVDIALCWGPGRRWWNNALIGARWASVFGILPSAVLVSYRYVYGAQQWTLTSNSPTGIPDAVGKFLTYEIAFAGSGLVLGALWRVLPGEHGPMRAFSLFIAWLIAILVLAVRSISENPKGLGLEVLKVVLMLTVLTMTSMWMDTDTFSRERLYGTKRLGLLTSLYEVRGFSGQVAFLIAQLVAMVTIWQTITTRK
ncbi:DUF6185 family protein [Streptomyces sp. NPDC001177]